MKQTILDIVKKIKKMGTVNKTIILDYTDPVCYKIKYLNSQPDNLTNTQKDITDLFSNISMMVITNQIAELIINPSLDIVPNQPSYCTEIDPELYFEMKSK